MAFCPDCGNQIGPDAQTCPTCGAGIDAAAAQAAAPAAPGAPEMPAPPAAPTEGVTPPAAAPPPPMAPPPGPVPPMGVGQMQQGPAWPAPVMVKKKTSGLAIASLVVSILCCGPLGIIFGFVAKSQIKKSNGQMEGNGLATAGIIVGILSILVAIGASVFGIWIYGEVKGPFDTTNQFIENVNSGNSDAAYSMLSTNSPMKRDYTKAEFRDMVDDMKGNLESWTAFSTSITNDRATVTVSMDYKGGSTENVEFELRQEGDDWRIYDFNTYDFEQY